MNQKVLPDGQLDHKLKVDDLKRKMKLLKEAVKQQRQTNKKLEDSLYRGHQDLKRRQAQSKRRDEKNEGLLLQIRVLRDALIAQKNDRAQLEAKLQEMTRQQEGGQGSKMSMANYFGLKGLFQR